MSTRRSGLFDRHVLICAGVSHHDLDVGNRTGWCIGRSHQSAGRVRRDPFLLEPAVAGAISQVTGFVDSIVISGCSQTCLLDLQP